MSRVVVAEKISSSGLDLLRRDGHDVVEAVGWPREKLVGALEEADALLVRSGTKVDLDLLSHAPKLSVIGRAGVGVDNIDMAAATRRGILVLNSPTGNVVSAVEHTFAVLLALLRKVTAASASLREGKWERGKFIGTELEGKILGIVGLGQVGSRVATRANAFGARVIGFDPYLPPEKARELGVALVEFEDLLRQADIVTLHATATDSAKRMMDAKAFSAMKPGAFLVNVARGSLVDLDALRAALSSGALGGAAIDVYDPEPPDASDPIFRMDNVVATPHLGASTQEAQERVASQTVEALREALSGAAYVPAVNLPFRKPSDSGAAASWMDLSERAARFLRCISDGLLCSVSVEAWNLPSEFLKPIALAAVKGALSGVSPETVNLVNAAAVARDRGVSISETSHEERGDYAALLRVSLRWGEVGHSAEGTIFGRGDPRLVSIDGRSLEFRPRGVALYVLNRDVPGVVGLVGTILGRAGVNIADFTLSRGDGSGGAASVLTVDTAPPPEVLASLEAAEAIERVRVVEW
ncbi:MAG: phosphoglycerate dehydrogenase [Thermoanaerobaculia bacterium]